MPKPAALLTLPLEILLHIVSSIDGKDCDAKTNRNIRDWRCATAHCNRIRTLRNLILTCKQLAPLGREALLNNMTISRPRLWKLLMYLLQHPDLVKRVTRIRVQSGGYYDRTVDQALIRQAALARTHTGAPLTKLYNLVQRDPVSVREKTDYMPIILAVCKNLREITLGTFCSTSTEVDRYRHPTPLLLGLPSLFSSYWPSTLTTRIRESVKDLNIMQEDFLWAETDRSTDLKIFKNLKSLSLPFLNQNPQDISPEWTRLYRSNHSSDVLPQSLQSLTIYVNNLSARFLYEWLAPLFFKEPSLSKLLSVRLYTSTPLDQHYELMKDLKGTSYISGLRDTVGVWKHPSVKFQTFFLPVMDYDSGNLENYVEHDWLLHLVAILHGRKLAEEIRL